MIIITTTTLALQLLHEIRLYAGFFFFPPLPVDLPLGLDLRDLGAELGILHHFVGGLENGLAPVGGKGVGLHSTRSFSNQKALAQNLHPLLGYVIPAAGHVPLQRHP